MKKTFFFLALLFASSLAAQTGPAIAGFSPAFWNVGTYNTLLVNGTGLIESTDRFQNFPNGDTMPTDGGTLAVSGTKSFPYI